jgi:hypothetical protein
LGTSSAIKPSDLNRVIVDTTVQPKNITFPTDAKLLNRAREKLVNLADRLGVKLRQSYKRVTPQIKRESRHANGGSGNHAGAGRDRQALLQQGLEALLAHAVAPAGDRGAIQRQGVPEEFLAAEILIIRGSRPTVHIPLRR